MLKAYCKFYRKSFDVGNMGLSALKSHQRGQGCVKVAAQLKNETKLIYFLRGASSKDTGQESSCQTNKDLQPTTVDEASGSQGSTALQVSSTSEDAACSGTQGSSTLSTEIFLSQIFFIHCLIKMVRSHYSFNQALMCQSLLVRCSQTARYPNDFQVVQQNLCTSHDLACVHISKSS